MEQVMLDMIPTGAKAVCHVSQYDIGRTIRFNLISGGAVYTLSGTETVKVYIKKPDGTTAERNIANTSSTYVDWVTGEGDCDQAGECECELVITSGTTVIGSKNFTVKIEEDPYNEQGVVTETAGPAVIATFTTNVVDLLQEVKCSINPIQNGTPWIDSNVINKVPYIKRAVAGTATRIGNHLYDKLVGGTVAFNQIATVGNNKSVNGINATKNNDNSWDISGTASADAVINLETGGINFDLYDDHVYFIAGTFAGGSNSTYAYGIGGLLLDFGGGTVWKNTNHYARGFSGFVVRSGVTVSLTNVFFRIHDLTAMFGSTIADYIYSLEQATSGAGVAWFKALFPNDYYAYYAGEFMSVKATAHIMRNASNTVIGNYPLDSNLELRGIPMLVNNKLEYDGDTYEGSGAVSRKYTTKTVDGVNVRVTACGIENSNGGFTCYVDLPDIDTTDAYIRIRKTLANRYFTPVRDGVASAIIFGCGCSSGASTTYSFVLPATVTNVTEANAWFANNPTTIIYPLATPTTETAQPFTNPQVCDENGTEEYTDSRAVAIPVGHETYQANICEITGFDELNVVRTGANLFDETWEEGYINSGTGAVVWNSGYNTSDFIRVSPNTQYYCKATIINADTPNVCYYNANKEKVVFQSSVGSFFNNVFTTPNSADICYMRITITNANVSTYNFAINYPSSDTQYHPYSGKLIKLEFDDTVYLAEVSCLNGVWKLKPKSRVLTFAELATKNWAVSNSGVFYLYPLTTACPDILMPIVNLPMCSHFAYQRSGTMEEGTFRISDALYIKTSQVETVADFKTWLANNNGLIEYEIATPVEITLDETDQFEALLGVNNVWHDGNGNTEVKYLYNA